MTPPLALMLLGAAFARPAPLPSPLASPLASPTPEPTPAAAVEDPPEPAAPAGPDRSAPPAVAPAAFFAHPAPEVFTLSPGVTVHWVRVPGARRVSVVVNQWGGAAALDGELSWRASLTGGLRDVATATWDAPALAAHEEALDMDVWTQTQLRVDTYEIDATQAAFGPALELLRSVLAEPTYPRADLSRAARDLRLHHGLQAPRDAATVAQRVLQYARHPPDHPNGRPLDLDALGAVRPAHLREAAARLGALGPTDVIVAGDVSPADWLEPLRAALPGLGADLPRPPLADPPPLRARVFAVDLPDNDQALVLVGHPAPGRAHPDATAYRAVDFALGGAFLSRLNKVLREQHGLTYGVHAGWSPSARYGLWQAEVDVAEQNVQRALELLLAELAAISESGATADEIATAANDAAASWNTAFQTASSAAAFYDELVATEVPVAERRAALEALRAVTPDQTREVAARWFSGEGRVIVVVGDRKAIEDQVRAAVGEPVWIDAKAAVLGQFDRGFGAAP
jgi:predicted Zn-dependent peptidase